MRAGDFIFVSGQVAKDANGNMISGTIEEETAGTIEAIRRILAEEGATLADVVRVTTYLEDTRDFGRYNKVFAEHFQERGAGPHDGRGARRDQHQDRNGCDRLQAEMNVRAMNACSRATARPEAAGLKQRQPAHISARGVAVDFAVEGRRQRVLKDINLAVPKGSFVSLIGPSGCGKSTLLKVMAGLIAPTEGEVRVAGRYAAGGRKGASDRPRLPGCDAAAFGDVTTRVATKGAT